MSKRNGCVGYCWGDTNMLTVNNRLDHVSLWLMFSTQIFLPNNLSKYQMLTLRVSSVLARRWPCRRVCGPGTWRTRRWLSCSAGRILRSSLQTWGRLVMGALGQSTSWVPFYIVWDYVTDRDEMQEWLHFAIMWINLFALFVFRKVLWCSLSKV